MKKKTTSVKKLFEFVIRESKCPSCGSEGAYVGLHDVECKNPKCRFAVKDSSSNSSDDENNTGTYWLKELFKNVSRICGKNWKQEIDNYNEPGAANHLVGELQKKNWSFQDAAEEIGFYYDLATGKLYGSNPSQNATNYPAHKIVPGKSIRSLDGQKR